MKLPIVERLFVALVFTILYASFIALPWELSQEFAGTDWISIALFHSYLFVFYPLFGLVALVAFYLPAVIFTNLYWHHIKPFGRLRFIIGFFVVVALSLAISANLLTGQPRAVWEIAQNIPASAANVTETCQSTGKGCNAGELLSPMFAVRAASKSRIGLQPFARTCDPDILMESPAEDTALRQCFLTQKRTDAATCCKAQKKFAQKAQARYINWDQLLAQNWQGIADIDLGKKSVTGYWHAITLPFKTFFILIIIIIAALLVIWHDKVEQNYKPCMKKMERGLIVSAIAMLFWPLMEYAYAQSSGVLFGNWNPGVNLKASLVILPWAVLIGVYFMRSRGLGLLPQLGSIVGALFAMLQYDQLTNLAVRFTGSGADWLDVAGLTALAITGLLIVLWPSGECDDEEDAPAQQTAGKFSRKEPGAIRTAAADVTTGGTASSLKNGNQD